MRTVLHYKTHFLNPSETFIHRFIANHQSYRPAALCYNKKSFSGNLDIYEVPKTGSAGWMNRLAFLLNRTLPYYRQTIEELRPRSEEHTYELQSSGHLVLSLQLEHNATLSCTC